MTQRLRHATRRTPHQVCPPPFSLSHPTRAGGRAEKAPHTLTPEPWTLRQALVVQTRGQLARARVKDAAMDVAIEIASGPKSTDQAWTPPRVYTHSISALDSPSTSGQPEGAGAVVLSRAAGGGAGGGGAG